ncbi:hypothetical protein A6R68_15578, partial [Neotoma lepida]
DVATDFRQEEFGCLDSAERTLPGNDKLKNYTNLVSAAVPTLLWRQPAERRSNYLPMRATA